MDVNENASLGFWEILHVGHVRLSTCYGYSQSIFAINGMVFLFKTVVVVILPDLTVETLSESGKFTYKW